MIEVTMVRIYVTESSKLLKPILQYLQKEIKIRGVSVFRAIEGFGDSGTVHTATFTDLSLDLPLAIEFFDHPEKVTTALNHLSSMVKAEHIVTWKAYANK